MNKKELRKMADAFLREHDTYYKSRKKNKGMEYPYLSRRQWEIRTSTEIPASNLFEHQKIARAKLECSIDNEE